MEIRERKPTREQIDFIYSRIAKHRKFAELMYGADNVVGVFVFGSWNLGSWHDGSDVDTITLIRFGTPKETIEFLDDDSGEVSFHADFEGYLAHFLNKELPMIQFQAVEILGAKYNYINPKYKKVWDKIVKNSANIIGSIAYKIAVSEIKKQEALIKSLSNEIFQYGPDALAYKKMLYRVQQGRKQMMFIKNFQGWDDKFYNCLSDLANIRTDKAVDTLGVVYTRAIEELVLMRKIEITRDPSAEAVAKKFLENTIREIHSKI